MTRKELLNMKLGEKISNDNGAGFSNFIERVPGGWNFVYVKSGSAGMSTTFVPEPNSWENMAQ